MENLRRGGPRQREAIARATELRPQVVIMDYTMPHVNGLEATGEIYRALPGIEVLLFTGAHCRHTLMEVWQSKACGCVLKSEGHETLLRALKKQAGMMLSFMVPTAKGLIFEFSSPHKQTLTIAYKAGTKILQADSDGGIKLPIDRASLAENPSVTLSEKPLKVSIDM